MDYGKIYRTAKLIAANIEMIVQVDKDSEPYNRLKNELDDKIKEMHVLTEE